MFNILIDSYDNLTEAGDCVQRVAGLLPRGESRVKGETLGRVGVVTVFVRTNVEELQGVIDALTEDGFEL